MGGNSRPELSALLGNGTSDVLTLHISLRVDDDSSIVFEVKEMAFSSSDGFALTDDDSRNNLLSEFGLTLLDRGKEHISNGASGGSVKSSTSQGNRNDV